MSTIQPEALRLADVLDLAKLIDYYNDVQRDLNDAAAELRRLHAQVAALTQPADDVVKQLTEYAMYIAHERELQVTGHKHDAEGALQRFQSAVVRALTQPAQVSAVESSTAYAELPEDAYRVHPEGKQLFDAAQMCLYADATHALRASHGQAPAGAKPSDAQIWAAREAWNQQTNEHEAMRAALIAAAPTQPAQAQAGAVPLTRDQVKAILVESGYYNADAQHKSHFMNGIRHGEAAHGIKHGGQHDADT